MIAKPVELLVDLGNAAVVGAWNFFMMKVVMPNFYVDGNELITTIAQIVTSLTSVILLVYLILRARKMYWDSEISRHEALGDRPVRKEKE